MIGETIVVHSREIVGTDAGNNPILEWVDTKVTNVIVAPGSRSDVDASNRPDGVKVAWELHFPKTFTRELRGCEVTIRGEHRGRVIGDPHPYTLANTPGRWWMPVEVEDVEG